jgi:hypothetical protein
LVCAPVEKHTTSQLAVMYVVIISSLPFNHRVSKTKRTRREQFLATAFLTFFLTFFITLFVFLLLFGERRRN